MIERYTDYISFSKFINENELLDQEPTPIPPVQFYKRGYRDAMGTAVYYGNPKSKKAYCVISGQSMQFRRDNGIRDAETLEMELNDGAIFNRIDLAVTEYIETELVTLWDVQNWIRYDLVDSSLMSNFSKKICTFGASGIDTIETLYIGDISQRGKRGIFRAYDKGIEMGIMAEIITRIELEQRGEKANNTANRIAQSNDIAGNFRAHFNVHADNFDRLMDSAEATDITRGKAKPTTENEEAWEKRWTWLLQQVAPAMRSAIKEDLRTGKGIHRAQQFALKSGMVEAGLYRMFDNARKGEI